jgi:hypothetical protein
MMDDNARPHNPHSARLSATGGNRATTLVSHASCTVPEHVSSFRESSVSVCVEGNVAIPEPKQSLIPECFDTSWYVRSNARPHTDIVQDYLQQEAIELLPWSAMSPDMNPIKHVGTI